MAHMEEMQGKQRMEMAHFSSLKDSVCQKCVRISELEQHNEMSGEGEQKGKIKATDFPGKLCSAEKSLEENSILINITLSLFFFFNLISEVGYRAEQRPGKWQPHRRASAAAELMEYLGQRAAILRR